MKSAITGGHGFLGWHLACRLRALTGANPILLGRADFERPGQVAEALSDVDVVYHLAGVNRAPTDAEVEEGNVAVARVVAAALAGCSARVVFANSIHAGADTPFGRGKARAAEILAHSADDLVDVHLPNLFGEHGRPAYNSFVATFCHEIAHGREPSVTNDRPVPLMHAQDAAQALMDAADSTKAPVERLNVEERAISDVLELIRSFDSAYGHGRGELPDLSTPFATDLFNTYRSYLFPQQIPMYPSAHADDRGALFEAVRSHGGEGQGYISTTVPGATRGDHYHLRKVERFFVIAGEAEVSLRRLLHDEVVTFRLSGSHPAVIDMPTMWVHNIRNVGEQNVVTMFWSNQLLDRAHPDQFAEEVRVAS